MKENTRLTITFIILFFMIISVALFAEKPRQAIHYKPYYITRDSDGTIWIGDRPGQKQAVYGNCDVIK